MFRCYRTFQRLVTNLQIHSATKILKGITDHVVYDFVHSTAQITKLYYRKISKSVSLNYNQTLH